jgi:hypothetical protein
MLGDLIKIIDDTVLIQVYATVLVGILIFFTIQRHFEYGSDFTKKSGRLLKQRENVLKEKSAYEDDLKRLKDERDKNVKAAPDRFKVEDYEPRIKSLERLIDEKGKELTTTQDEMYSRAEKYRKRRNQYISLKTEEGIVALNMIVFMVASIIALLFGATFGGYPGVSTIAIVISVVLFSIGIILLVLKVYLHGIEID